MAEEMKTRIKYQEAAEMGFASDFELWHQSPSISLFAMWLLLPLESW